MSEQAKADDIVGHKTFSDGRGGFRHEPLTRAEADLLWERAEQRKRERAERMPTAKDCAEAIFDACQRLEELGWKRARLCHPDGVAREIIELGSTGIHTARCEPRPTTPPDIRSWWWHDSDDGDVWPVKPIYYKP